MLNIHANEKLLHASVQQFFPDVSFEGPLKSGEHHNDYFVRRDYLVRLATAGDIESLMEIEGECWAVPLQTDREEIKQRLIDPACFTFVLEYEGIVRGVIYTQRIQKDKIKQIKSMTVPAFRDLSGSAIQFLALNMMPVYQDHGWGSELIEFVLQYFSLHPEIHHVYAVTRCRDFMKSNCATLQQYLVYIHRDGLFDDPILKFHQLHGATILGLLENYRPKDDENQCYGVLIEYDVDHRPWGGKLLARGPAKKQPGAEKQLLEMLNRKLNRAHLDERQCLQTLGLDSLDFAEVLSFMHDKLGLALSIRDLNDRSLGEILRLCGEGDNASASASAPAAQPLKERLRQLIRQYPEIVPLSANGDGPCTFWIHPLSGDVGIYNRIANQADGAFRIIAIKARGFLSYEHQPFTSLHDMARYYCEIITAVQPEGPYQLAGFSFGGTVAYEMARQLQMLGKRVETLLLVESPCILGDESEFFQTTFRNNLLMNANFLLLTLLNRNEAFLQKRPDGEIDWNFYQMTDDDIRDVSDYALVPHIVKLCKQKGLNQSEEELAFKLSSMSEVHQSNLNAIQNYRVQKLPRPNELTATLFRTESADAVSRSVWNPDYLERIQREMGSFLPLLEGWTSFLPNLQTIILEGDNHFDILHADHSIKIFYDHCKSIFTNRMHTSRHDGRSAAGNDKPPSCPAIAIVGMSGRFPDADNVQQFWENLKTGLDSVKETPRDRGWDINDYYDPNPKTPGKTYSKRGGFLTDIDKFDPLFFKVSPRDAELMDPSERLFIQEAWKAIEDAGYDPGGLSGKSWGVFACAKGDYSITIQQEIETYYLPTDSYSACRLSYLLDLVGPAMSIDTSCSSTLAVLAEACDSLVLGNCEAAIAGGGAVYTTPNVLIGSSQSLLLSPDGLCYTFDERANGTVVAEAIGVVVLKLLDKAIEDNDHIYGVIRGWGMNQDGRTNGMTAPSGLAQSRLQTGIYEKFDIDPANITMFEAHGTGTKLGDAIEYEALTESFRKFTAKTGYCALGALKSNIGHAFFGSGIAGLIKVLLSIKHGHIPPTLNYENGSSNMSVANSPFYVNTTLKPWETASNQPRCAAINSFGATGTNVHLVVEEFAHSDNQDSQTCQASSRVQNPALFVLSAKDDSRLDEYVQQYVRTLEKGEYTDRDLTDIAYTMQVGRGSMNARLAMTATSIQELRIKMHRYLEMGASGEGVYRSPAKPKKGESARSTASTDIREAEERWLELGDASQLLDLWVNGAVIDWERLNLNGKSKRISLPTYPFAKERCWIQANAAEGKHDTWKTIARYRPDSDTEPPGMNDGKPEESHETMMFTEDWEETPLSDYRAIELNTIVCFLSDPTNQNRVKKYIQTRNPGCNIVFLSQNNDFRNNYEQTYYMDRHAKRAYEEAFRSIRAAHNEISAVLYLWPYEDRALTEDYSSIVYILQAIASAKLEPERLLLGASYTNERERCYLESWIGFERSIGSMVSKTRVKAVIQQEDGANPQGLTEEITARLYKELEAAGKIQSVLYEEGQRYECNMKETGAIPGAAPLKAGGTYFITGGLGKLGLVFARHLAQKYGANLILSGRSKLDAKKQETVRQIEHLGGRVRYIQADTCDRERMREGLESARRQFGEIDGVIHAAGLVDPQSIFKKELTSFEQVIAPKINGTLVLDELLQGRALDFVCYFSSSAAILGDFGTCDYAVGNRFLMAYTRYKNKLEAKRETLGKTVVVNWPLWRDGGMGLDQDNNEKYLKSSGQRYLETEEGLSIFERILTQPHSQYLIMAGQRSMVYRFLKLQQEHEPGIVPAKLPVVSSGMAEEEGPFDVKRFVERDLKEAISQLHHVPVEKLDVDEHLLEYGFDSINLFEFADRITSLYGVNITPSSLLGYSTIGKIIEYLVQDHEATVKWYYRGEMEQKLVSNAATNPEIGQENTPQDRGNKGTDIDPIRTEKIIEPIAIIGMSGRFPQADSVEMLWHNLKHRKESITEVPRDRWDWRDYDGEAPGAVGTSHAKWGGFLTDIDRFDPLFFKISPKEARIMDPCQRLFLEESWHALEDAGYMGERIKGKSCGVYVGIEEGDYGFMVKQQGLFYSNQNAVLSARIAYLLDLKGPNLSVTASCSSGLVALHQACQALRQDDCEMALAGGINLFVSPSAHIGMSMLDLVSPTGKSYVFDERADGMVPSEAVAVVVLKPLSKAIRDKDHIYGCIKGSGVNHNGKGHGMMAPNPVRQAELMRDTLDKYRIDPSGIQYMISHSVGTKLGDAAEMDGLRKVFGSSASDKPRGYIGSIKPLIGHTFAASGIVSLMTMLMAMREQTMLGLHNFETGNADIDFSKAPFQASESDRPWIRQDHRPRLGAISTSANSGTNAFTVIEEYVDPSAEQNLPDVSDPSRIFVFSATDVERLHAVAKGMRDYIASNGKISLIDLAYTLQVGREALASRLAIVAKRKAELIQGLDDFLQSKPDVQPVDSAVPMFIGNAEGGLHGNALSLMNDEESMAQQFRNSRDLDIIAMYWAKGGKVAWSLLFQEAKGRVISLPNYPFKRERYWIPAETDKSLNEIVKQYEGRDSVNEKAPIIMGAKENEADFENGNDRGGSLVQEEVERYLVGFFSEKLEMAEQDINVCRDLQDYGADSILMMKLIREVEQRYDLSISGRELLNYPTIRSISALLAPKLETGQSEYQDLKVIEAMEKFVQGVIRLDDLEKRIGVDG
ncbi:SDR family NAD(P)-dependent oxidoreductase [Paenibacillus sp. HJL G12]|uniref:SDR family NAD(P)-dependent oxidoreductase n=1 Tax=Paenibacillus dendrobii TaxID=2691084 RepID=A0A7X3IKA0_9BACL|nr:SDR family NAD(P)-dependent oxidoreductase [Paenibacillus dendrobii]MWV45524.1 SDR family NAD(P)-dependent oxidoreductase [Paenibacillus dendrobii]